MPMHWNERADARLFAAVIKIHNIKINYEKVAEIMGPDCTAKAICHRVSKIKEKCKGDFAGIKIEPIHAADAFIPKQQRTASVSASPSVAPTPKDDGASVTSTPKRRGRPPKSATSSALKRTKMEAETDNEGEQQPADRGSPSLRKKAKTAKRKKALPYSPVSAIESLDSSTSSSPATIDSASSPPEISASNRIKPILQPSFYFDDVVTSAASPNVNVKVEAKEGEMSELLRLDGDGGDDTATLAMLGGENDDAAFGMHNDPQMSFADTYMSFDFCFPDWDPSCFGGAEDSFATVDYNE